MSFKIINFKILFVEKIQSIGKKEIYSGFLNDKYPSTIKKLLTHKEVIEEENILKELGNSEKFPKFFFMFSDKIKKLKYQCAVFESYVPLKSYIGDIHARSIAFQIFDGIEFLHSKGFSHGKLCDENIAVTEEKDCVRFKINNFGEDSSFAGDIQNKSNDLSDFSRLLSSLYRENKITFLNKSDEHIYVNLIQILSIIDLNKLPTPEKLKTHPIFLNAKATLLLIVEFCEIIEMSLKKKTFFTKKLLNSSTKICGNNWTTKINPKMIDELNKICDEVCIP